MASRETGFTQGSVDWVNARLSTVGASEIFALTGSSPFETPSSLLFKKLQPRYTFTKNVACTRGNVSEPLAREFFERKHSVSVFGYKSSITPHPDSPLSGKLSFSPDGFFFEHKQNALKLLEFKCPHTRRIVRGVVPDQYLDQIQTGLLLSNINKTVCVDSCFRMCSWGQLNDGMSHNSSLNNGRLPASSKREVPFAWGVCILFAKNLLADEQSLGRLISLGSSRTSFQDFQGLCKGLQGRTFGALTVRSICLFQTTTKRKRSSA